jgi:hypothetical protein
MMHSWFPAARQLDAEARAVYEPHIQAPVIHRAAALGAGLRLLSVLAVRNNADSGDRLVAQHGHSSTERRYGCSRQ